MRKVNISFAIFLVISVVAMLTDYLAFFCKMPYQSSLAISSAVVLIAIIVFWRKIKKHICFSLEKKDIFFFAILAIIFLANIASPSTDYDTLNYHIYLQENPFADKINHDYFAGKHLNSFLFPLGDRIHYIFRYLLGYRLGVICSYLAVICIYYQVKRIISHIVKNKDNKTLTPLFACAVTLSSSLLTARINSYYIDIFSAVLILEVVLQCLSTSDRGPLSKISTLYLFGIAGIATAVKLPNAFLAISVILCTLCLKRIKPKIISLIIACAAVIVPILPYAIDNYNQTGSPIFPYYNKIFGSPYFAEENFEDDRFDAKKIYLLPIWPIYTSVINPDYGDKSGAVDITWTIGYISIIGLLLLHIKNKKSINDNVLFLVKISIVGSVVWFFGMAGYMRYAIVIPVIYLATLSCALLEIKTIKNLITNCILAAFAIFSPSTVYQYKTTTRDFDHLFIDKDTKIHIDGAWGVIGDDSSLTVMAREEGTPIINLNIIQNSSTELVARKTRDLIENKEFYMLVDDQWTDFYFDKVKYLKECGYEVIEELKTYTYEELPYLTRHSQAALVKVRYTGDFPDTPVYNEDSFFPTLDNWD